MVDESFRMSCVSGLEDELALFNDLCSLTVVDRGRGWQSHSRMTMFFVVPREEQLAERAAILNGSEATRKFGSVFEGAKLAFRVRVVIGNVRTAVDFGDAQVGQ